MEWGRLVLVGVLCGATQFLVGYVFHLVGPLVVPGLEAEFRNAALFRPWAGWTWAYMAIHPWVYGFLFAGGFLGLRRIVGTDRLGDLRDGLLYGLGVFAVGSLPVYALNFASFQVPAAVIVSWVIQSLCQYAAAGAVLGTCCERHWSP